MDIENKKKRAKNFCDSEVAVFTDILLPKYKAFIENKKTDAITRGEKAKAWQNLTNEFNSISKFCFRSEENLKNLWDKLKKNARKAKAHERSEIFATGGGTRNPIGDPTNVDMKVLEIIGPSGVGLINQYDGDAACTEDNSNSSFLHDLSNATIIASVPGIDHMNFSSIVIPQEQSVESSSEKWDECVPRMLCNRKPDAIRPCSSTDSASITTVGSSSSSTESIKKRSLTEEMEWAKQMKRRRPTLVKDETTLKLNKAKLELTEATKLRVEEENERNKELFEIEKKRKESEAELAHLQVLKMRRDLGLE